MHHVITLKINLLNYRVPTTPSPLHIHYTYLKDNRTPPISQAKYVASNVFLYVW